VEPVKVDFLTKVFMLYDALLTVVFENMAQYSTPNLHASIAAVTLKSGEPILYCKTSNLNNRNFSWGDFLKIKLCWRTLVLVFTKV
jgi:hypothetical protein